MKPIKRYFQDYTKYFPEEWDWELSPDKESRERYMRFRARKGTLYKDKDLGPFFDSIEKDANQFGLRIIEFTDFFGIKWKGEKGRFRYVGDADYDQHLYYSDPDETDDDGENGIFVSDEYTVSNPPKGFGLVERRGVKEWIDVENAIDLRYNFIVENHLFKDSCVVLSYDKPIPDSDTYGDNCESELTFDIHGIAKSLHDMKPELYKKLLEGVNEHFKKLQESDRQEERDFAPEKDGKFLTAEEYFDEYFAHIDGKEG